MKPVSEVYNEDCMIGMARYPDKFFDLAIVDPPFGIGAIKGKESKSGCTHGKNRKRFTMKDWDSQRPDSLYFKELFRVSKHQIIWGGNYFTQFLPPSMGWIFWDKGQSLAMSDGEIAYTSFQRALRRIVINRANIIQYGGIIHPTQKPVRLYKWLLENYAEPGLRILDTHLGSGSSRIAAYKLGFDFCGFEIDTEYYIQQESRFKNSIHEPLFT